MTAAPRLFALLSASLWGLPAQAQSQVEPASTTLTQAEDPAANSGQDPTKPVSRFDVRAQYEDISAGVEAETLTLRLDKPFSLGSGWKLSSRIDVPLQVNDVPGVDNPAGKTDFGLSDVLIQALVIAPSHGNWTYAFGTQLLLPTGTQAQFTSGKWQAVPTVALVRQLPAVSPGSFAGLLVRDKFSFAGSRAHHDINVLSVEPLANFQLPQRWFITIGPEAQLDTLHDWKLFLPFDFTVGKKITKDVVVSLQTDIALIKTYEKYDWKTELRVGFFF